jgi:hypothetical protein
MRAERKVSRKLLINVGFEGRDSRCLPCQQSAVFSDAARSVSNKNILRGIFIKIKISKRLFVI